MSNTTLPAIRANASNQRYILSLAARGPVSRADYGDVTGNGASNGDGFSMHRARTALEDKGYLQRSKQVTARGGAMWELTPAARIAA